MPKPKVGQRLFSLNVGNNARRVPQVLRPVVVTKVGRKYFSVEREGETTYRFETEYHLDSWSEKTEYSPNSHLYATEQEWEDEKKARSLREILRKEFGGYGESKLPLQVLEEIATIIERNQPEQPPA